MYRFKYNILFSFLLGLSLISCNDDYEYFVDMVGNATLSTKVHYVGTYDTYSYFSGEGGTAIMTVMSENTPWRLSGMPDWVSASPDRGSSDLEVNLAASINPLGYERTAIFSLESNDPEYKFSQDITAVQYAGEPYIYLGSMGNTERYIPPTVTGAEQTVEIPLFTNLNQIWWKRETTTSLQALSLSIDVEANKMMVKIPENSTNNVVSYPISITPNQSAPYPFTRYLTIYQEPAAFKSIDHTSFSVSARPASVQFVVDSEVEWNATCPDSWIQLSSYKGGIGKETVKVDILENASTSARRGTITMRSPGNKLLQVIEVNQAGMQVSFNPEILNFSEKANSQTVTVTSDMDWTVISMPSWVKVDSETGKVGSVEIKVSVEDNKSVSPRSGEIVFSASSYVYKLKVVQSGLPFSIGESSVFMPWKASSVEVNLTCSGNWTTECSENWVSVSPESGSNSGKLTIATSDNPTANQRTAQVTVISESEKVSLLVVQQPQVFTIESTSGNFNVSGGTVTVSYRSNVSAVCTLSPDPDANAGMDWITCQHDADPYDGGQRINTFTFTAAPNPSSKMRAAYALMKPKEGNDVDDKAYRLHLRQPGRNIYCDVSRISFFHNGGTSPEYVVNADGEFEMALSGEGSSWLKLEVLGSDRDQFKVTASPNTTADVRSATLIISLKNLPDGEVFNRSIPIVQYPEGVVIIKEEWSEDINWGSGDGDNTIRINLPAWGDDKNWNI